MYEQLKRLIPIKWLKKNEDFLRRVLALRYKGNTVYCNICNSNFSKFIQLSNNELLCPKCGCLPRTRKLLSLLLQEQGFEDKNILHFSPPKGFRKKLDSIAKNYITTDYEGEFDADKRLNIEAIDEEDNIYEIIICYHVLEHIIKDEVAIKELFRVLKPNGVCYIQTPFKDGEIYEDYSITSKEERLKHFGQDDHVRIYSVNGLVGRLNNVGFEVEVLYLDEHESNNKGFSVKETVLKAVKKG